MLVHIIFIFIILVMGCDDVNKPISCLLPEVAARCALYPIYKIFGKLMVETIQLLFLIFFIFITHYLQHLLIARNLPKDFLIFN